jgi:hypothetical protein
VTARARVAIILAAVLVVAAIGAVIAFATTAAPNPASSPSAIGGKEQGPPTATPSKPTLNPTASLLSTIPPSGDATGRLVGGFPTLMAPPAGSDVASSSIAVNASRVQISAAGTAGSTADQLQDAYRQRFTALGMTSAPVASAPGSTTVAYYRGGESITVTTTAQAQGTGFTVFGLFRGKGA